MRHYLPDLVLLPGPVTKRPLTVLELGPLFGGDGK